MQQAIFVGFRKAEKCTTICVLSNLSVFAELQCKPLNVIALGKVKTDNNNRMITIADFIYT
jgi:hypothetical protein